MARHSSSAGFTLVELMIVIGILSLLMAVLVPAIIPARDMAYELADRSNLQRQYQWLQAHQRKLQRLPLQGGHKFVLSTWTAGIVRRTVENFDRFWPPGPATSNDPRYYELRAMVARGQNPWTDPGEVTSLDTGYAGRARSHLVTLGRLHEQAMMADDNEFGWSLRDGTVNVLFDSGVVRTYSYPMLQELFGLPAFDPGVAVATTGAGSPIEVCKKLDL